MKIKKEIQIAICTMLIWFDAGFNLICYQQKQYLGCVFTLFIGVLLSFWMQALGDK